MNKLVVNTNCIPYILLPFPEFYWTIFLSTSIRFTCVQTKHIRIKIKILLKVNKEMQIGKNRVAVRIVSFRLHVTYRCVDDGYILYSCSVLGKIQQRTSNSSDLIRNVGVFVLMLSQSWFVFCFVYMNIIRPVMLRRTDFVKFRGIRYILHMLPVTVSSSTVKIILLHISPSS
jgi:hypothetical protein